MPDLAIRPYEDGDEDAVLHLLAETLGKQVDDRYRGFFRWKHLESPFGRSFMWVAHVDGVLAGFRAMLRWRFLEPSDEPVEAVRAVDTATSPDFRGLGVFRTLTLHALDELRPLGISFVFNTPNDQSRPGYLKMGWVIDGRVPVQIRPGRLGSLVKMSQARTAADPWSLPAAVGHRIDEVPDSVLGAPVPPQPGALRTARSAAILRWRYGGCPGVASAAVPAGEGVVLIRFRRRGASVECTVGDVVGTGDRRAAGRTVRAAMAAGAGDYAIASAFTPVGGMVRSSRLGPIQTRRQIGDDHHLLPLALSLGDVELF